MGLLASCHGGTARRAANHLARQPPQPNSATPRAAQERRRFRLARAGFVRPRRQPTLPALLGNALVPGPPGRAPLAIPPEYSRLRGEPLREKLGPSAIARSGLAGLDRSEPPRRFHLPIQSPFESGSRRCQIVEMSPSSQPPNSNGPGPGPPTLPRICPRGPSRYHVHIPTTEDRTSDSRSGPEY